MGTEQQPGAAAASGARAWRLALAGLAVGVFAALALSGPGRIDIVDGQTRYEVARSLVDHGDSVIRDQHVWFAVLPGRDGLPHTNYRLPQSALGALAITLADATGPTDEARRQFFFTLISPAAAGLLALAYAVWFRGLGHSARASLAWAAAGIFCTPCWYYGTSTFDDLLATAAAVPAVIVAYLGRQRRPLAAAALAGLLLGLAFNCKQPLGLFVLPVLAAGYRGDVALRRRLAVAALVLAGLALGVAAEAAYDAYKFPPETRNPATSAEALYGAVWSSDPLPGLCSLIASPSCGMLWYCPTLVLSVAGWMRWWRRESLLCAVVLITSVVLLLFFSWLTFFKGDPSWGPRYLTPVYGLWWLFTPAAAGGLRRWVLATLLAAGAVVQLLALSVDPQRLYLQLGLPFNYYVEDRWLGFDPALSHLWQRPREIAEILASESSPEFSPGPTPTYAATLPSGYPVELASTVGLLAPPAAPAPLAAVAALPLRAPVHAQAHAQAAVQRYHIFASLRPWWLSQQYLAPSERPVALLPTVVVLAGLGAGGLALALRAGRSQPRPAGSAAASRPRPRA